MKHKIPTVDVPEDEPFKFDALERRQAVESLVNILDDLEGPFVLAINAPWGTGKTTLIRMLKVSIEKQDYHCLYFDAWATDFFDDPLVAFLGELASNVPQSISDTNKFQVYIEKSKILATAIAKIALPIAGKIGTHGLLDLEKLTDQVRSEIEVDTLKNYVDAYEAEKSIIKKFHEYLKKVVDELIKIGGKNNIIIFIDELDRCRPTYAISLLERIKHLFDIENIIFVLALDKHQLDVSLGAVYGDGINSEEYLRRFIDLEYLLPKPDSKAFINNLATRFHIDGFFSDRKASAFTYDRENMIETFIGLSDIFNLSLRAMEQCFTRISILSLTTPSKYYIYPNLLTTLVVLREASMKQYTRYAFDGGSAGELIQYIRSFRDGPSFLDTHIGILAESFLIAAKRDRSDRTPEMVDYQKLLDDTSSSDDQKRRPGKIMAIIGSLSPIEGQPNLAYVVNKIEVAARYSKP